MIISITIIKYEYHIKDYYNKNKKNNNDGTIKLQ